MSAAPPRGEATAGAGAAVRGEAAAGAGAAVRGEAAADAGAAVRGDAAAGGDAELRGEQDAPPRRHGGDPAAAPDRGTRHAVGRVARGLPGRFFRFYWGDGIADDVPALAYYLVLSLAPFALGLAALEALLLKDVVSALAVSDQLNRFLPEAIHADIRRLVLGTRDNSPLLLALALFAMLWTTSGAIGVIERCLSRMLDVPRHNIFLGRMRNLALGALVAIAVILASLSISVATDLSYELRPGRGFPDSMLLISNALGSLVVFAIIYRYAPLARIRWRSALLGAIPGGIAIQAVPTIVGLYVSAAAGFAVVQVFLLLAIVLLGLYIVALLLLVGAGIAARTELRARARRAR